MPEIRGNEWRYAKECLETAWVSSVGSYVDQFERLVAEAAGTKYAVATVNGTAALHVALLVAGVQPDDEVLVSTLTFIAPVNAIRYVGAWPVFIDAEPDYWQMDPARVEEFLTRECARMSGKLVNKKTGRRVSAILPVHVLGHPVDMDPVLVLARQFDLRVIEDATEGLGARYKERPLGQLGDIGCFSFNGNKIITTGGGGMLVTNRSDWAERAKYLTTQAKDDPVEYVHGAIGYNYRLTNVQAAIGCGQMELLTEYVAKKRQIARRYSEAFGGLAGITPMREAPWAQSTFWLYTVLVDPSTTGSSSRDLLAALGAKKIQSRPLWQPIHQSAAHRNAGAFHCPVAESLAQCALSLPCSVGLLASEQERVIEEMHELVRSTLGLAQRTQGAAHAGAGRVSAVANAS